MDGSNNKLEGGMHSMGYPLTSARLQRTCRMIECWLAGVARAGGERERRARMMRKTKKNAYKVDVEIHHLIQCAGLWTMDYDLLLGVFFETLAAWVMYAQLNECGIIMQKQDADNGCCGP